MTAWRPLFGLALGLCLAALPAAAREPCIRSADPEGIALEDSIEDEVAAARAAGLYHEAARHWSPDFALGGMVRVEATERGTAAAGSVRAALPLIDAALARAEAGARITEAGNAAPRSSSASSTPPTPQPPRPGAAATAAPAWSSCSR